SFLDIIHVLEAIFAIVFVPFLFYMIWQSRKDKRDEAPKLRARPAELPLLAQRLGFGFRPEKDFKFADKWSRLDSFEFRKMEYSSNIFEGERDGHRIVIFDLHYWDGKHYQDATILILELKGGYFPEFSLHARVCDP